MYLKKKVFYTHKVRLSSWTHFRKPENQLFLINLGSWIMLDKLCEPSTSGVDKKCFVDYIQLSISLNFHLCVTGPFKMSSVCWCRLQATGRHQWKVAS